MKNMGLMHYFIGLEVWQRFDEIFLSQGKYRVDVLHRFAMMDCKSMATPMVSNLKKLHDISSRIDLVDLTMYKQLIGSLLYLMHMRPIICYVVCYLGQFMSELRHMHWVATTHVLIYLHGIVGYELRYTYVGGVRLFGYTYSDWASSTVD